MIDERLEELVTAVLASAKYRHVSPGFVRSIGVRELAIRPNLKAAIKATKNTLHQAGGAFQDAPIDYARALARLQEAWDSNSTGEPFRDACRAVMAAHTSTRERLPILDEFYAEIFAALRGGPPLRRPLGLPIAGAWAERLGHLGLVLGLPAEVDGEGCRVIQDFPLDAAEEAGLRAAAGVLAATGGAAAGGG